MLKTAPHFVLASSKSSTYLRGYASGVDLAAASAMAVLSILQLM